MASSFSFNAELWEWVSRTTWFFFSVPEAEADDIEEEFGRRAAGFGSIRVEATIGSSTWRTSIFPSTEQETYVLPVKKAIRKAERLEDGSTASIEITIITD